MGSEPPSNNDLIATYARENNLALVINATSVRVSRLTHPALAVLDNGYIPKGREVAIEFRRCIAFLGHLYSGDEKERIEQLANVAETFHIEFQRDPSRAQGSMHPLAGALGRSYYYPAFLPRLGEHQALKILRATLLRVITSRIKTPETRAAAQRIRDVLTIESTRRFDKTASADLAEAWSTEITQSEFSRLISPYWHEGGASATAFAKAALIEPAAASTRKRKSVKAPEATIPPKLIGPSGLVDAKFFIPPSTTLDAPPVDEIPPEDIEGFQHFFILDFYQDDDEPLEVESGEALEIAAFEFEQTTRHHLEGVVLPDTDRVLSTIETETIWRFLIGSLATTMNSSTADMAATITAALMLITGRRRAECLHAILNFAKGVESSVAGALRLLDTTWVSTIQPLPELRDLPSCWFHPVSAEIELPLPEPLILALSALCEHPDSNGIEMIREDEAWLNLRGRLRENCPRFTETRCMHTLPVQVALTTGHLREAQWLSGSTLEHSNAAGHYYATPADRLRTIYRDTLAAMGIQLQTFKSPRNTLIGAQRAALRLDKVSDAIQSLVSQTESSVRLIKTKPDRVVEGVYALGAYLAIFFGFCTAHRFTSPIGDVTRRDILISDTKPDNSGFCLVADKTTSRELDARVCVLPPLFTKQCEAYLRQLVRAERRLNSHKKRDDALLKRIRSALDGTGPLWVTRDAADVITENVRPNRHVLADLWPEWEIPLPMARHLFASNAARFDIGGSDIALQMGHSIGPPPFDDSDPDSPKNFSDRIGAHLERYVRALGFQLVGWVERHGPPPAIKPYNTDTLISNYKRLYALRQRRRREKLPGPTDTEREQGHRLVHTFDVRTGTETVGEWVIDPQSIQQLLKESASESIGVQQVVRGKLADLIALRRKEIPGGRQKRRPFVPQMRPPENSYNAFSGVHFDAARWALAIEKHALAILDAGVDTHSEDSILAATVILLASYGAGSTLTRLLDLLNPDQPIHVFEKFEGGLFAEMPLGPSNPKHPNGECQFVSGDQVALIAHFRRHRSRPPTKRDVEVALLKQRELDPFLPTIKKNFVENILKLIGLGRQCFVPGTRGAWERGELDTVGPKLSTLAPLLSSVVKSDTLSSSLEESGTSRSAPINRRQGLTEYRRLSHIIHDIAAARKVASNRQFLIELADELRDAFGPTSLISLLAAFALYLDQERGLAPRSVYEYMTTLGARLIKDVGAGDILGIDPGALEASLRQIAIKSRSGGSRENATTVASAASHFSELIDRAGVEIDLSKAFDGLDFNTPRRPGYIATQATIFSIAKTLSSITDHALDKLSLNTATDSAIISEAGALIQMAGGLRVSEVAGLLSRDLVINQARLSLHVHPIKRRRVKSKASRRLTLAPIADTQRLRLLELLERLKSRLGNTGDLALAPDIGIDVPAIARMISRGFRDAACLHIDPRCARGHISRHNSATAAVLATHPGQTTYAFVELLEPIAHFNSTLARLIPLQNLPQRLQFRYLSKQLGHSRSRTTLQWYAHSVTLLHAQTAPWRGLSRKLEASLFGLSTKKIDRWRGHHGGTQINKNDPTAVRLNPKWFPTGIVHQQVENTDPDLPYEASDAFDLSGLTAELAASVALTVREGIDEFTAAAHWGLTVFRYRALAICLDQRDRGYRLGYLTGRRVRPRGHPRIPRSHDLRKLFRRIDEALQNEILTATILREWMLEALSVDSEEMLFDVKTMALADVIRMHKRAVMVRRTSSKETLRLPPSDRQLILLVIGVVSWIYR